MLSRRAALRVDAAVGAGHQRALPGPAAAGGARDAGQAWFQHHHTKDRPKLQEGKAGYADPA